MPLKILRKPALCYNAEPIEYHVGAGNQEEYTGNDAHHGSLFRRFGRLTNEATKESNSYYYMTQDQKNVKTLP